MCMGGAVVCVCVCVAWKREKVGKGKGGWAGFDTGAGLIAIMIWPIRVELNGAKGEKMRV